MSFSSSYSIGLCLLSMASLCWISASMVVQYLYSSDEQPVDSPFLVTYVGTSLFAILLPIEWLKIYRRTIRRRRDQGRKDKKEQEEGSEVVVIGKIPQQQQQDKDASASRITQAYVVPAAKISPIYFLANYCFNASLRYASITSTTVLASCAGPLLALLLALILRDESFSYSKVLGVLFGMIGSFILALHDASASIETGDNITTNLNTTATTLQIWGDMLALLSAIGYGGYTVMLRIVTSSIQQTTTNKKAATSRNGVSAVNMQLLLGCAGSWNLIVWSPIVLYQLLVSSSVSNLWFVLVCLIVKGLLDNVLGDYFYARAVVLTSATVASVGGGLQVPLAFFADALLGRRDAFQDVASMVGGSMAVLLGFVLVNVGQEEDEEEKGRQDQLSLPSLSNSGLIYGQENDILQFDDIEQQHTANNDNDVDSIIRRRPQRV